MNTVINSPRFFVNAYIYGMDEQPTNRFPAMKATLPHLKKWYPSVPIMSTCFDYAYGEDGMLSEMDVFIPDTTKYDFAKAQLARANGRKVWWSGIGMEVERYL